MKTKTFSNALGEIGDQYVSEAISYTSAKKKNSWMKWGAMVACLCLVVVGAFVVPTFFSNPDLTSGAQDDVPAVIYNGAVYVICGTGEAAILEECGLPIEITEGLAGEHLGYLEQGQKNIYYLPEAIVNTDVELFEYAPEPNKNVYILCIKGEYYAAIRRDENGYHGLQDER